MKNFYTVMAVALLLTGCGGFVRTNAITFHGDSSEERGAIAVLPLDEQQKESLSFKSVSEYVLKKLAEKGYTPTRNRDEAKFLAFISYGIDNGKTTVSSVPIFGQTGGGTSYSSGTVTGSGGGYANYSGTTTTMKTYGVVGTSVVSGTEFKRDVNIDIYKVTEPKPIKKYELRGVSYGSCGTINGVLPSIIDGMFTEFPGQSGKSKSVDVKWDGDC
jgi:hypothetical protein